MWVGGCVCAPAINSFSLSLWNDIIYPSSLPKKIICAFELKLSCTHPIFDKKQQILKIHWQKGWAGWQGGAATIAGEKSVRVFMVAIQRATSNVALVQQVWKYLPYPSRALILIIANRVGPLQLQTDDSMPWSSLLITEITWLTMNYYRIDKLLFFFFFFFRWSCWSTCVCNLDSILWIQYWECSYQWMEPILLAVKRWQQPWQILKEQLWKACRAASMLWLLRLRVQHSQLHPSSEPPPACMNPKP